MGLPNTSPPNGRVEDLNQEPPDYKSSVLTTSNAAVSFREFLRSWSGRTQATAGGKDLSEDTRSE